MFPERLDLVAQPLDFVAQRGEIDEFVFRIGLELESRIRIPPVARALICSAFARRSASFRSNSCAERSESSCVRRRSLIDELDGVDLIPDRRAVSSSTASRRASTTARTSRRPSSVRVFSLTAASVGGDFSAAPAAVRLAAGDERFPASTMPRRVRARHSAAFCELSAERHEGDIPVVHLLGSDRSTPLRAPPARWLTAPIARSTSTFVLRQRLKRRAPPRDLRSAVPPSRRRGLHLLRVLGDDVRSALLLERHLRDAHLDRRSSPSRRP